MNVHDVRCGSGTDISRLGFHVRFAPDNGHRRAQLRSLFTRLSVVTKTLAERF